MKKTILLCSLFSVIGSVSFVLGFSNVDVARFGQRYQRYSGCDFAGANQPGVKLATVLGDAITVPQVLVWAPGSVGHKDHRKHSSVYAGRGWANHDNPVVNVMKNHIWYSPEFKDISKNKHHSGLGSVIQPVTFAAADFGIKKSAEKLNEFDSVKSITQSIPEQHRTFVYKNGKMVAASFVAHVVRNVTEGQGLTTDLTKFAQAAEMQVAAEGFEEYAVTSISDRLLGKEQSTTKDVLNIGLTVAGFVALNTIACSK